MPDGIDRRTVTVIVNSYANTRDEMSKSITGQSALFQPGLGGLSGAARFNDMVNAFGNQLAKEFDMGNDLVFWQALSELINSHLAFVRMHQVKGVQ